MGEYLYGLGKGHQTIACVTLGTGIGAGLIVNGKIFHGGLIPLASLVIRL